MSDNAASLKPCPFCGSTDMDIQTGDGPIFIICNGKGGCGAEAGFASPDDFEPPNEAKAILAAINLWNRRA